jgi:hypothetical protein
MRFVGFIAVLCFLVGCASVDQVVLDSTKRAPTTTADLYEVGKKPSCTFKEIARFSFNGQREDELKATRYFLETSKKLGANGVILLPVEDAGMRGNFSAYGGGFKTLFLFRATAVVYQ